MCDRHSVDVAALARFGRIDVAVCIEPDHAQALFPVVQRGRDTGNGAHGQRVVSAEDEWGRSIADGVGGDACQLLAHGRDRRDRIGPAVRQLLALRHDEITVVADFVSEGSEPFRELGDP